MLKEAVLSGRVGVIAPVRGAARPAADATAGGDSDGGVVPTWPIRSSSDWTRARPLSPASTRVTSPLPSGTASAPITLCGSRDAVLAGDSVKNGYTFYPDHASR